MSVGDGPPRDREHGGRAWRDHDVFPSDTEVRRFLNAEGREGDWSELRADTEDPSIYDLHDEIDLACLEPLIALPSSPGNVVPVREVAGTDIYQVVVGSSAIRARAISPLWPPW